MPPSLRSTYSSLNLLVLVCTPFPWACNSTLRGLALQTHLILRLRRYCIAHCMYHVCHPASCVLFEVPAGYSPIQYYDTDAQVGKKRCSVRNTRAESSCARVHRITGHVSIRRAEVIASQVCMEQNLVECQVHMASDVLRASDKRGVESCRRGIATDSIRSSTARGPLFILICSVFCYSPFCFLYHGGLDCMHLRELQPLAIGQAAVPSSFRRNH